MSSLKTERHSVLVAAFSCSQKALLIIGINDEGRGAKCEHALKMQNFPGTIAVGRSCAYCR